MNKSSINIANIEKHDLVSELIKYREIEITLTRKEARRLKRDWDKYSVYKYAYAKGNNLKGTILSFLWAISYLHTSMRFSNLSKVSEFYYDAAKMISPIEFYNKDDEYEGAIFKLKTNYSHFNLDTLRSLAEQGDVKAQYNLAVMHADGNGVKKNMKEAMRLYEAAAKQGLPDAQYALGWFYGHGNEVQKDKNVAIEWFRKAAESGHEESQKIIKKIKSDSTDQTS